MPFHITRRMVRFLGKEMEVESQLICCNEGDGYKQRDPPAAERSKDRTETVVNVASRPISAKA